jgi:hypothetical protein
MGQGLIVDAGAVGIGAVGGMWRDRILGMGSRLSIVDHRGQWVSGRLFED